MDEQTILRNALDRADPAERSAYLDETCAGDPELRQRLEEVLRTHSFNVTPSLSGAATADFAGSAGAPVRMTDVLKYLAPPAEPGHLGRLDQYEIHSLLGRGGFGMVVKGFDAQLRRPVASKLLAPQFASNGTARRRFVREAQAAAAVVHDHVVAIHAVRSTGPVPYLVMQYIDGASLQQRIDMDGPLPVREVVRIGREIAAGLAAAHERGLVHRDIKPANIL